MACIDVICAWNATCAFVEEGYTCRCDHGFKGDGYTQCERAGNLDEHYMLLVVLIILLFVGLLVILIFFLCKRWLQKTSLKEPLVDTVDGDPYETKWGMLFSELKQRGGPPPYSDVSEIKKQPDDMMTTFIRDVEEKRVPVVIEDEDERDVVDIKEMHNPVYTTFVKSPTIEEDIKNVHDDGTTHQSHTNPSFQQDVERESDDKKANGGMKITLYEERDSDINQKVITTLISTPSGNVELHLSIDKHSSV